MGQGLSPDRRGNGGDRVSKVKLEKRLESHLLRWVKKSGGLSIKLYAVWYVGIPDRMILLPGGRVHFVELKREGGKPRPNQQKWLDRLTNLGFDARAIAGEQELEDYIYELSAVD